MDRRPTTQITACMLAPWLLLTSLVLPMAPVAAQDRQLEGQPIVEVEWQGLDTLTNETLDHYLFGPKREGTRKLDLGELDRRLKELWQRELIDDIQISAEEVDGGVKLLVQVSERPILIAVDYVGIKRVSRSDIIERIDHERIQVYESQPIQHGELGRLKATVEDMYREKGYRFAEVSYSLEPVGPGQQRVVFTIDEGDRVKIGDVRFDGNTVFNDLRLRTAMRKTKESGLLTKITKKDIYNPATLDEDLDKVRDLYRKAGYKDILIAKPEIDVFAKRPQAATVKEQKRRLAITIPVEEGDRWKLGEITIEGNEVFSDEALLRQFEKPRGGWLRSKVIDDAVERIGNLYSSLGYVFSELGTELRERDPLAREKVADLVLKIDENDQYKIGRIEFDGNEKTRDKVLRREMLVQEAGVMNTNAMQNSLLKIRQLNYFKLNEEEPIKFKFDDEEKTVDLTVLGEEAERTELQFGGGWSERDGFFGQFSMRTTNFLGRGETFGVSVQSGRFREFYNLEYNIPWFLDRPQNVGISIFNQSFDDIITSTTDFQQRFSGGSVTYGRSLAAFQSLSVSYSFTDVSTTQTLTDADGVPQTFNNTFTQSTLRPFWIYNTIDSRFEPTRGLRMTGSLEFTGSFLGGETEYLKPVIEMTWFKPVGRRPVRSSLGINLEAGLFTKLEDLNIFSTQRFFLGGENSVRGFRRRSLVVRNEDGTIKVDNRGVPLGGERYLQGNLEFHLMPSGPFRVVLFADAGGVWDSEGSIEFSQMRYTAGAELRILVPLFGAPLRFIWASNLDPLPDDQFESFDFNIGTSF